MSAPRFDPLGMMAYRSPTESTPRVPHVQYPTRAEQDAILAALEPGTRAITRRIVAESEARASWRITVADARRWHSLGISLPISGDHRRFVDER